MVAAVACAQDGKMDASLVLNHSGCQVRPICFARPIANAWVKSHYADNSSSNNDSNNNKNNNNSNKSDIDGNYNAFQLMMS